MEITSEEQYKDKRMKRTEDGLRDLWDNIKCTSIQIIGVQKKKRKKKGYEKSFEEIIVENFPNMEKEIVNQKTKIMASGPITSWQVDGETMETVRDFIFLGSKITADGDCSHETKRCLLLGRNAMTNLDSILKTRDITLLIKSI